MAWWATASRVVVAAESFYDFGDTVIDALGSNGVSSDEIRRLWWMHMARTVCKYDLSLAEWRTAMEPTIKALHGMLGYVPSWIPPMTKEAWKQLRIDGGCPAHIDWKNVAISAATIVVSVLVAWAIASSEEK